MNSTPLYALNINPLTIWSKFAWKIGEMMLASMHVSGHRSHRILSASHPLSDVDRREFALMRQEKVAAAAESAQAMALALLKFNQQFAEIAFRQIVTGTSAIMSLAASRTPGESVARQTRLLRETMTHSAVATSQLSQSAARVAQRGLTPIHSRATANSKRLAKRS